MTTSMPQTTTPAYALHAVRTGIRTFGPDNRTVLITESLMDSRTLWGMPNTETLYSLVWLDTTGVRWSSRCRRICSA